MRLHRLEIEGFGPFRQRQVVDFDGFADDGIFLIAGRTGAGKSSILDAICFGLYGGVPRYDGGEKRLRSDHCEPDDITEVLVEFSTPAGRFRVRRSPDYLRPAKRGGGMTKQAASVSLDALDGDAWVGRAARAVDVGNELDEILQLSREQFLQVILLAQNRFADFLLADSRERQRLLRRLFGTQRFDEYQQRFEERRRVSQDALGGALATVEARLAEAEQLVRVAGLDAPDGSPGSAGSIAADAADGAVGHTGAPDTAQVGEPDEATVTGGPAERGVVVERTATEAEPHVDPTSSAGRLAALERAQARAAYRAERLGLERADAERRMDAAAEQLREAAERKRSQQERDRARTALSQLDAQAEQIEHDRARLQRAAAAEALRAVLAAADRAAEREAEAAEAERQARERWAALEEPGVDEGIAALRAWVEALVRESGAWAQAAELEGTAAEREAALTEARTAVDTATDWLAGIDAARAELPARIAALTMLRDEARRDGDRLEALERALAEAEARRVAAESADALRARLQAAETTLVDASTRLAEAQQTLADLRRRRLEGFAGELATGLVPGEPCAVCGAVEHPSPAEHADPVSADDIDAAEGVRDAAAGAERDASEQVASLRAELAAAEASAGGRNAEQAAEESAAAEAARANAAGSAALAQERDVELTELTANVESLEQERSTAAAMLAERRERLAADEQRAVDAQSRIEAARGAHTSVAERLTETEVRITAARAFADAQEQAAQLRASAEDAGRERDAELTASDFADAAEARAALLSDAERAALDERLRTHAVQREKERERLLDLELLALDDEPIDLTPLEHGATAAREAWRTAVDEATRADSVVERLDGLVASAGEAHGRSAAQAADHEVLQNLADTIAGRGQNTRRMALETFVLAAELEEIVAAANERLGDMSEGRYQLRHSDERAARNAASGLGIVVFDAFTGQARPARSLSGGETFLSSLALALGLAEVVTSRAGGIRLDTLFIDEGFGSLDAGTLEVAMRTLDELRQGGRTVGVISHVEAMQEQIPAQLTVRTTSRGDSVIRA